MNSWNQACCLWRIISLSIPHADHYTRGGGFPVIVQYWAVSQLKCVCLESIEVPSASVLQSTKWGPYWQPHLANDFSFSLFLHAWSVIYYNLQLLWKDTCCIIMTPKTPWHFRFLWELEANVSNLKFIRGERAASVHEVKFFERPEK